MSPFVPPGVRIAAAIGVVGTFLVTGSFVLGRVTAPDHSDSTPAAAPTGGGSAPPVAAAGRGIAGAPTRVNSLGIPVGYPHTQAGAISACGNYVSAYGDIGNRINGRLSRVLQSISTADEAKTLAETIRKTDSVNAKTLGVASLNSPQVNFNLRVVGYRIVTSSRDRATVSIWSTGGFGIYGGGDENTASRQVWGTDNCTVLWSGQDWRLAKAVDGPDGPAITDRTAEGMQRFSYIGGVIS